MAHRGGRADDGTQDGTEAERIINTLELYVFDKDGSRDTNTKNDGYVKITGEYKGQGVSFTVTEGEKIILVAANMDLKKQEGKNMEEIRELISNVLLWGTGAVNPLSVPAAGIPMAGESSVVEVASETTNNYVTVYVSRLFTKLLTPATKEGGVEVTVKQDDLEEIFGEEHTLTGMTSFDFKGYAVVNGLNKSYAFANYNAEQDELAAWDIANFWKIGSILANYHRATYETTDGEDGTVNIGDIKTIYSGKKNNSFWLKGSDAVFVYENVPTEKTSSGGISGYDKQTTYAMLIQGTLTNGDKTITRYWRYNVNKEDEFKILRNAQYRATINRITTKGYGTPEKAEEDDDSGEVIPKDKETGIIASISVVPWRLFSEDTDL